MSDIFFKQATTKDVAISFFMTLLLLFQCTINQWMTVIVQSGPREAIRKVISANMLTSGGLKAHTLSEKKYFRAPFFGAPGCHK